MAAVSGNTSFTGQPSSIVDSWVEADHEGAVSETGSAESGEVAKTETKWQSFKGETTRRIKNITDEIILAGATILVATVTVIASVVDAFARCTFGIGLGVFGYDKLSDFTESHKQAVIETIASGGDKVGDAISWLLGIAKSPEERS